MDLSCADESSARNRYIAAPGRCQLEFEVVTYITRSTVSDRRASRKVHLQLEVKNPSELQVGSSVAGAPGISNS